MYRYRYLKKNLNCSNIQKIWFFFIISDVAYVVYEVYKFLFLGE